MAASIIKSNSRISLAMERTGQWVFSQEIPTDVVVEVGEANFALHKFMLVAKSNYIRKLIMDSKEPDLERIDLSYIPGGPEIFEKAAKFCYGVNFEITVHNVAALRCAADYLQMTDKYCDGNLAGRTEDFLSQVALTSLSGAVVVLKSCEDLLPLADELNIVQRCIDVISIKVCKEANFPSRSPANWWTEELSIVDVDLFEKIIVGLKSRGAKSLTLASAIITYAERSLRDLLRDSGKKKSSESVNSELRIHQRKVLESIVTLLPTEKSTVPINFLCCLLRTAIYLKSASGCRSELEKRISTILEHVTVDDLLVLSSTYDGDRMSEHDSVRRIISGFVEKEKSVSVFNGGDFKELCSTAMQRVSKTVDAYIGEIATDEGLSISKFNGITNLVPKGARKVDDDLYRAVDIYLKAHPNLDEIEREKVCSSMDALKLSYEARLHASQNKRLPVQVVLHALYYDQLNLRSGDSARAGDGGSEERKKKTPNQVQSDVTLVKENEALREELTRMKMYITDMQKGSSSSSKQQQQQQDQPSSSVKNKGTFFSSVSRKLGKLNPFRNGSKDTSNIEDDDDVVKVKPRRRRFSIS
ncbi:root phototropism protein 2-like [Impatiens glandulifera]|uniref:root phototropism protein 2-like n=1 Tax=Impatiens glandulifera TaxID=253017 RepID=UPI001FB121C4|nr:root phototropism protein 2-like [Impatiens glandulifera]